MATSLFKDFFKSEKSGGLILVFCTILSLLLTNSSFQESYTSIWSIQIWSTDLMHLINDGLMTIFFLLIGLELEREIYNGELSDIKKATLPVGAAIGGMLVPATIYFYLNIGTDTLNGAGIPVATDIAFALGILSLLGKRVPLSLKIFLTALAVIDDLGAILIIGIFYTKTLVPGNLLISLSIFVFLLLLNRMKIRNLLPYLIGGLPMWYFMQLSGIHGTISGVMLAFAIPFGNGDSKSTSFILQKSLHKPVAFFILPLFALANTAIHITPGWENVFSENYGIGILLGLVIGKPLGITLICFLLLISGLCKLPVGVKLSQLLGAGFLGGIGFTMSIFITLLAFDDAEIINKSKLMILIASTTAGIIGYILLHFVLKDKKYAKVEK